MARLFGTDGVRGVANDELTCELAFKLGQATAQVLDNNVAHKAKILVGKDTRISSDMLEAAIASGICSVGAHAELVGVIPTPAVAFLTRKLGADAGIVISASHNSMEYNGIKIFNSEGYKLSDEIEDKIEYIVTGQDKLSPLPTGNGLGRIIHNYSAKDDYIDFAKSTTNVSFSGLKIAIDCANGASSGIAKDVLQQLGAQVFVINDKPDGININENCGSTHMQRLQSFTTEIGAHVGFAFDGDADRVLAVDEKGNVVNGDKILLICAAEMKNKGMLKNNTVVATVMSNLGMFIAAKKLGINVSQAAVGDRYVIEEMLSKGHNLGGEQSGHIIFHDCNTTGDGIISAIWLASVMISSGKTLSDLAGIMQELPQVLINVKVKDKEAYLHDSEITAKIKRIEQLFSEEGRVLIRPSGTEPLVRVMIEGADINLITKEAKQLADLIEKKNIS